ncbi:hypothetical protein Yalta_109 [Yalta virus]|nr:hypothetical protein Yalta_109 [Yalta virus]
MNLNTINLDEIYFETEKNNRRSLKSLVESMINKLYKKNKISIDEYHSMGGTKEYNVHKYEKIYESSNQRYPHNIICQTCKKGDSKAITPNNIGFECFGSLTKDTSTYNVKAVCSLCNKPKNSYVSINNFPDKIKEDILDNEKKIRKRLF